MDSNIYAPPKAALAESPAQDGGQALYVVSLKKFYALYFGTLGLYSLYWYYKNWALIRDQNQERVTPLLRTLFAIFFVHALFRRIEQRLHDAKQDFYWPFEGLATLVVLATVISSIISRFAAFSPSGGTLELISIGLMGATAYMKSYAQRAINVAAGDANGARNGRFTGANIAWLVLGGVIWLLTVLGIYALLVAPLPR